METDINAFLPQLITAFERVKIDILKDYVDKGMLNTGETGDSLEVESEKSKDYFGVSLWGSKRFEQLEYGRKPSDKMPPLQAIYDWLIKKRVFEAEFKDYQIRGLAYVIARKIQREGWDRKNHGGVRLISGVLTDQRIKSIIDEIGKDIYPIFVAEITNYLKTD